MKPEDLNDPKKKFAGVRQQSGAVTRDADWNKKRGPRRGVRILGAGALVMVLGAAIAAGWLFLRSRTTLDMGRASFVAVSLPVDGAFVPVHGQQYVIAEAYAASGVRELQLWVNDQQWGSIAPSPARDRVTQTWDWVPSSEGQHHLVARLVAADGSVTESALVRVYASAAMDVRFPVSYETQPGDTAGAIARRFGSDLEDLLDSNRLLDPNGPLPGGVDVTVPIPIGGTQPPLTDYGEPAVPPAGGVIVPVGSSAEQVVDGVHQAQAGGGLPLWKAFTLNDGKLKPNDPVDLLYLYLSVNGKEWGRIPEDPDDYLQPVAGVFDLTSYLKKVAAQAGGGPVPIHAEVWGWRQGEHTFLGSYFGNVTTDGGGLQTTAAGATQLRLIDFIYLGKENYKQGVVLTGDDPDLDESFRWTTTLPGVTYALWQVSDAAFPAGSTLNPPGLVHSGLSAGNGGKFDLDFSDYFDGGRGGGGGFGGLGGLGGFDFPNSLDDLLGGKPDPTKQFNPWLPKAFFIRVIPMKGQAVPGFPGVVAGPPSPALVIIYTPKGAPFSPKTPPNGPVYEARVVGFQFFREADPDYAACTVLNYDVKFCQTVNGQQQCQTSIPKGTLGCGCPGVSCKSSGSSCGEFSLDGVMDCGMDLGQAAAGAIGSIVSFGTNLYNGAVDFVTDALASVACGGLSGDAKKACEAGVGIAVNVGLASLGLPPHIPDFEKLMNEGLDYALAVAAQELTAQLGFECDMTCQDLVKAGIEGVKNPDKLFDDGLAFAADRAREELEELGVQCDAACETTIQQAAQGEFEPGPLLQAQLQKAANEAAAALNAKNIACNQACRDAILQGLQDSRDLVISAANAAATKPTPPPVIPHPLAVRQPAVVTVEIFRRWESAGIPAEDLNHCGLSLFTSESTNVGGSQFSFSPFFGKGLELPAIDPGETIQVPIALDRKFSDITPAMIEAALAELKAKGIVMAGLVDATGQLVGATTESGVVSGGTLTAWHELYHGGVLQVKLTGPAFLTVVDGNAKGLPCVAEETWSTGIPAP